jgi:hypothetical protein
MERENEEVRILNISQPPDASCGRSFDSVDPMISSKVVPALFSKKEFSKRVFIELGNLRCF